MSKEHVISKAVLIKALGKNDKGNSKNITSSSIFNNKLLIDYEQTINDVCKICNKSLSPYDDAGIELIFEIDKFYDATNKIITLDSYKIGWLVKTHLNIIRLLPRIRGSEKYPLNSNIYYNLINFKSFPQESFSLFYEGWKGKSYFWDENNPRRITYISFQTVEFPLSEVLVSFFRLKSLSTYMFLPSNNNYKDFAKRVSCVTDLFKSEGKFQIQPLPNSIETGEKVISIEKPYEFNESIPMFHELKQKIT